MVLRLVGIAVLSAALLSVACAKTITYTCALNTVISSTDARDIRHAIKIDRFLSTEVPVSEINELTAPPQAATGKASVSLALTSLDRAEMIFEMNGIQQFNASKVIENALNGTNTTLSEVSVQVNATFAIRAVFSVSDGYSMADFRQDVATDLNVTLESITVEELNEDTEPSTRRLLLSTGSKNYTVTVTASEFSEAFIIQNVMMRPSELLVEVAKRSSVQLRADKPPPAIVATVRTIFTSVTAKSVQDLFNERLRDVTVSQLTQRVNANFLAQGFWSRTLTMPTLTMPTGALGISRFHTATTYVDNYNDYSDYVDHVATAWYYGFFGSIHTLRGRSNNLEYTFDLSAPRIGESFEENFNLSYNLTIDAGTTDAAFIGSDTQIQVIHQFEESRDGDGQPIFKILNYVYLYKRGEWILFWSPTATPCCIGWRDRIAIEVEVNDASLNGKAIGFNMYRENLEGGDNLEDNLFTLTLVD
jgi:hypothetical protein